MKILKIIVDHNPNKILGRSSYTKIANFIVSIFPKEQVSTYYCPSSSVSKFQKGKLFNAFHKYRYDKFLASKPYSNTKCTIFIT